MLKPEVIEAVRNRTDIVALIGETVRLQKKGPTWKGCCPFHKEKTPSFHVSPERNFYYCHGCKEHGSPIDFVMKTDGSTFVDSVRMLAERLGIEVEETRTPAERQEAHAAKKQRYDVYRANELAAGFFEQCLWRGPIPCGITTECRPETAVRTNFPGVSNAWAELTYRGLGPTNGQDKRIGDTLRAFRVGFAPAQWDALLKYLISSGISPVVAEQAGLVASRQQGGGYYDRFRNRLMFAVTDVQGRVVGFSGRTLPMPDGGDSSVSVEPAKYVNTPESKVYVKGRELFGLWQAKSAIRRGDEAILVEGNFDVVSLHAKGLDHVVAPLGTAFTDEQATLLKRFGSRVVVAFDGDAAGTKATTAARDACATAALSARVVSLPQGTDPDAFVRDKGVTAFQKLVLSSAGIVEWLIDQALNPATFHQGTLQDQLARVRAVADVLAKEPDPELRRLSKAYADKAAAKLGLTRSSTISVEQLHRVISARIANGDRAPTKAVQPRRTSRDHALCEAVFGAFLDVPEMLDHAELVDHVARYMSGDWALAFGLLFQREPMTVMLDSLPESVRGFAAERLIDPQLTAKNVMSILHDNLSKLERMNQASQSEDLLQELKAASDAGDTAKVRELLGAMDALIHR